MALHKLLISRGFKGTSHFSDLSGLKVDTLRAWYKNPDRQKALSNAIRGAQLELFTREDWVVIHHYLIAGLTIGQSIDRYIEYKR